MNKKRFTEILQYLFYLSITIVVIYRREINGVGSLVFFAGMWIMTIIRMPFANRVKNNNIIKNQKGKTENWLLFFVSLTMSLLPILHLVTGLFNFANYSLPQYSVYIGACFFAIGLYLFWRSHKDLGDNWSVTLEIREKHELITNGIYTYIRHPMYASILLMSFAQPLLIQNYIAGVLSVVAFLIMYIIRRKTEEKLMYEEFGNQYIEYCNKTGRVLPFLIIKVKKEDFDK